MSFFERIGTNIEELERIKYKIEETIKNWNLNENDLKESKNELIKIKKIISHWKFYGEI
jgi:hypothetical protein